MGKGLLFFCCSCCILVLTIVNLSIGPIINGTLKGITGDDIGTLNCAKRKDDWDDAEDLGTVDDDTLKYGVKYLYDACIRKKGMHDMEYTSFIFDIVIGFVCGFIGLLHLFDLKKDFVSNTGLIGLICGVVGFALTFVYVIFNGLVYTTVYAINEDGTFAIIKRDGDYAIAEKDGDKFKCLYFDHEKNDYSKYAKISDLGKKQYNYDKDGYEDYMKHNTEGCTDSGGLVEDACMDQETFPASPSFSSCNKIYVKPSEINSGGVPKLGIEYKDLSDRFLTTLILSLIVCLANIGLALFGFLLFRTPGDF